MSPENFDLMAYINYLKTGNTLNAYEMRRLSKLSDIEKKNKYLEALKIRNEKQTEADEMFEELMRENLWLKAEVERQTIAKRKSKQIFLRKHKGE